MQENKLIEKKGMGPFEILLIAFFTAYSILPSFGASFPFVVVLMVTLGYCLCIALFERKASSMVSRFLIMITVLVLAYVFTCNTYTIASSASNRELKIFISKMNNYLMMFFPLLMFYRLKEHAGERNKKFLLYLAYALVAYVFVKTLTEMIANPGITRHWSEFAEISESNIGSYSFVYSIPYIAVIFGMFLLYARSSLAKIIFFGCIIVCFYFLLLAQYTLALLITIIGLVLLFVQVYDSVSIKALIVCLVIAFFVLAPYIFNWLADNVPSESMSIRLREIGDFFSSGDASSENLGGRMTLYIAAFKDFLRSPLYGHEVLGYDPHSTFLNILSDTGLLGFIPFIYVFTGCNKVSKLLLGESAKLFTPIFFMLVAMGLTNPIHSARQISLAVWFIVPLTIDLYINKREVE
ncbi:MAG: hypothetical protein IJE65_00125 [Clostridia bacterium]|nr:hypothetical protein [Clostridia bacterium]